VLTLDKLRSDRGPTVERVRKMAVAHFEDALAVAPDNQQIIKTFGNRNSIVTKFELICFGRGCA
jgi:hypothetical protein